MGQAAVNAARRAEQVRQDAKIFIDVFEKFIHAVAWEEANVPPGHADSTGLTEARANLLALLTSKS